MSKPNAKSSSFTASQESALSLDPSNTLYLGCLPKNVQHQEICEYFWKGFSMDITVELSYKLNNTECRGYGTLISPTDEVTALLIGASHNFKGRSIIVERIKSKQELETKYENLRCRKLKVLIKSPSRVSWTQNSFRTHFEKFGKIENAHLKMKAVPFRKQLYFIGNITYVKASSAKKLWKAKQDRKKLGYALEHIAKQTKLPSIEFNQKSPEGERTKETCALNKNIRQRLTKNSPSNLPHRESRRAESNVSQILYSKTYQDFQTAHQVTRPPVHSNYHNSTANWQNGRSKLHLLKTQAVHCVRRSILRGEIELEKITLGFKDALKHQVDQQWIRNAGGRSDQENYVYNRGNTVKMNKRTNRLIWKAKFLSIA